MEESARLAAARLSPETARLPAKTAGLAERVGLTAEGIGLAAGLISSAPWSNRWGGSSARDGACRRREHELPQLIVVLIFIDLDAGSFVRAGDTCNRTDLIARGGDALCRRRLTRVGKNLVDEIQRGVGILRSSRLLPDWLSLYTRRISLLLLSRLLDLCDRYQLAVRINPESWRDARLDSPWQSSRDGRSRELPGESRNLAGDLSRNLSRYLSRSLSRNKPPTELSRYLSWELWIDSALGSRLCSWRCAWLCTWDSQRNRR